MQVGTEQLFKQLVGRRFHPSVAAVKPQDFSLEFRIQGQEILRGSQQLFEGFRSFGGFQRPAKPAPKKKGGASGPFNNHQANNLHKYVSKARELILMRGPGKHGSVTIERSAKGWKVTWTGKKGATTLELDKNMEALSLTSTKGSSNKSSSLLWKRQ